MAIVQWDPWSELVQVQRDVQELFGRTSTPTSGGRPATAIPPLDAYSTEDGLVLRLDVPGVAPDQIAVEHQRGAVTITGTRPSQDPAAQSGWLRRERPIGSFTRTIGLPEGVDAEGITAEYEHGVLELRVPKAAAERATRIPVATGSGKEQAIDVDSREAVNA